MHVKWGDLVTTTAGNDDRLTSVVEQIQGDKKREKPVNFQTLSMKHDDEDDKKLKEKKIKSDLYYGLFPIYHISKICGLIPAKMKQIPSGRYIGRLHCTDISYGLILTGVLLGMTCWGMYRDLKDGYKNSTRLNSPTAMLVTISDVSAIVSLAMVCILHAPFRWKYLQTSMDQLVEVDEILQIYWPRKMRRFTTILVSVILLYLVAISTNDIIIWHFQARKQNKMPDKGPLNYISLYLMYIVILTLELQFALAAYNVDSRFSRLNVYLENVLKNEKLSEYFKRDLGVNDLSKRSGTLINPQSISKNILNATKAADTLFVKNADSPKLHVTINRLMRVHSILCDTTITLNEGYGLSILFVALTSLLHLIITPYVLITQAGNSTNYKFLIAQASWCVFHIGRLLVIVQPCYSTALRARETAILISQILATDPEPTAAKQLEIFALQILQRPLYFSACGLFTIDRALVTSIAGAVTTYLVILIQFQKADEQKGDVQNFVNNATHACMQNVTHLKTTNST